VKYLFDHFNYSFKRVKIVLSRKNASRVFQENPNSKISNESFQNIKDVDFIDILYINIKDIKSIYKIYRFIKVMYDISRHYQKYKNFIHCSIIILNICVKFKHDSLIYIDLKV